MGYKYKFNEDFFEEVDTEEKAYFLGFLYADGYNQEKGSKYISITLNPRDIDILQKFIKLINGNQKVVTLYKRGPEYRDTGIRLQINSKKFSYDISRHGCFQNKTNTLQFPGHISASLYRHFIRGYFDGDGSVWEGKRKEMIIKDNSREGGKRKRIIHNVKFSITGTIDIIKNIQDILVKSLSFRKTKINYSKNIDNCVQLEYSGRLQMKKFYNFLYDNSTIWLDRKKQKFEQILKIVL